MPTDNLKDIGLPQFAAGAAGALVSMRFISGTWFEKTTMPTYPTPEERWGVLPFDEWKTATDVHELVHSSRVIVEPEKEIPSPKQPE